MADTILDTLITDRTKADAQQGTKKGLYNAADLNRVESAVSYLTDRLKTTEQELYDHADSIGVSWGTVFNVPYTPDAYNRDIKTDWTKDDIPRSADLTRYLGNIKAVVGAIPGSYPALPETMRRLTWSSANNMERALQLLDENLMAKQAEITMLLDNTAAAWMYSGDLYAGET